MKVLAMSWVKGTDGNGTNTYELYMGEKVIITVGNYYDSEHVWVPGVGYELSMVLNCEKKFRTAKNCMAYVEKSLKVFIESCFFETQTISENDWKILKDRIEAPGEFGYRNIMCRASYQDVTKALKTPFKKIPTLISKADRVTRLVYDFRLEKGV